MQHKPNLQTTGQIVLLAVAVSLILSILALTGCAMFGTQEQFTRAKELMPVLISVLTPLLTAATALYLAKK